MVADGGVGSDSPLDGHAFTAEGITARWPPPEPESWIATTPQAQVRQAALLVPIKDGRVNRVPQAAPSS